MKKISFKTLLNHIYGHCFCTWINDSKSMLAKCFVYKKLFTLIEEEERKSISKKAENVERIFNPKRK